jgi:dethiobiotin synthetase
VKLFVTGTDTGVGKTFVTAALARRARELGRTVFAFKPIETGCVGEGADQTELCAAAGSWQRGELRGLYTFPRPAAPLAAAGETVIDLARILRTSTSQSADVVLVEGAGGWRVPITKTADMAELAVALGFPVLIVARATLGTINHSLITAEAVESSGCRIAGLVLSQHPEDDGDFAASNLALIQSRWSGLSLLFTGRPSELDCLFGS